MVNRHFLSNTLSKHNSFIKTWAITKVLRANKWWSKDIVKGVGLTIRFSFRVHWELGLSIQDDEGHFWYFKWQTFIFIEMSNYVFIDILHIFFCLGSGSSMVMHTSTYSSCGKGNWYIYIYMYIYMRLFFSYSKWWFVIHAYHDVAWTVGSSRPFGVTKRKSKRNHRWLDKQGLRKHIKSFQYCSRRWSPCGTAMFVNP